MSEVNRYSRYEPLFGSWYIKDKIGQGAGSLYQRTHSSLDSMGTGYIKVFSNVVGDSLSPFLLFAILVLLVQVVSEFMSNSTAILIVLPIVLSIAPQLHLNPYSFALGITLASGVALSCPLASSTLGMSMSVGYKFNDYFKYSIFYDILAYLVIIAMVPAIYGLTI